MPDQVAENVVVEALPDAAPGAVRTAAAGQQQAHLIYHGQLVDNDARLYEAGDAETALPADEPGWLVRLPVWLANQAEAKNRQHPLGIWIAPDDDIASLPGAENAAIDPQGIWLLAIDFPQYTDGRGYSFAQILRNQYGWKGQLRAVGDVMIDTIHYQARCGFDSFLVKPGHDPQLALKAFQAFTVRYQRSYPAAETMAIN
ncbi:DUF934 domain-containing protein [Kerstersia similis]|uniref:DUF934 domain-containing protein n=1 Tax=Kerstersia similis TaxID=206505 RepID=UPI0039F13CAE